MDFKKPKDSGKIQINITILNQFSYTAFANGKRHDFRLFKESKTRIHPAIGVLTDTGYQGLKKLHCKNTNAREKEQKEPSDQGRQEK